MRAALLTVIVGIVLALPVSGKDKGVIGSWEGDSKCTVPSSPCQDEHVLFQIAEDRKDPFLLNLDAYRIVEGVPDFFVTLTCQYESKAGALSCTSSNKDKDDWEFHIMGDTMAGRMLMDKALYRRITLRKSPK